MGSIQMPGRNGQQAASAHTIIRGQSKREWAEKSRTSWRSGQEREVCHCRTRKAPPTNPVPHLWQVEFLPVNTSSPFIWPFVGGWAHPSQPSGWGKIQTEWGDSMKNPLVWLPLSQSHLHWPLSVVWPPLSKKRGRSLRTGQSLLR